MVKEIIRVLIVDDMPQVRQGLSIMLALASKNSHPKIEVVGEAQNGEHAIQQVQALQPEVILMDLEMPLMNGYLATQWIKANHPSTFVIVLTIHDDPATRKRATQAGADAFIAKSAPLDGLVRTIQDFR